MSYKLKRHFKEDGTKILEIECTDDTHGLLSLTEELLDIVEEHQEYDEFHLWERGYVRTFQPNIIATELRKMLDKEKRLTKEDYHTLEFNISLFDRYALAPKHHDGHLQFLIDEGLLNRDYEWVKELSLQQQQLRSKYPFLNKAKI